MPVPPRRLDYAMPDLQRISRGLFWLDILLWIAFATVPIGIGVLGMFWYLNSWW